MGLSHAVIIAKIAVLFGDVLSIQNLKFIIQNCFSCRALQKAELAMKMYERGVIHEVIIAGIFDS
jgi:hypothetical protein